MPTVTTQVVVHIVDEVSSNPVVEQVVQEPSFWHTIVHFISSLFS